MEIQQEEGIFFTTSVLDIFFWSFGFFILSKVATYFTGSTSKVEKVKEPKPEPPKEETKVDILQREIKEMKAEAEQFNNPSTFAKHAKINRKIIKKENELEEELKKQAEPSQGEKDDDQKDLAEGKAIPTPGISMKKVAFKILFEILPLIVGVMIFQPVTVSLPNCGITCAEGIESCPSASYDPILNLLSFRSPFGICEPMFTEGHFYRIKTFMLLNFCRISINRIASIFIN
ncbi:unnamed protein product [Moneuplotes crassus]|uniref:Uncharacterized protein n=1 Tax=Euplotes crassus TaxID=5936 RepID=A0AAD2D5K0_EUPCR|nr:unnamed protein product [Moneuplotes crassus]